MTEVVSVPVWSAPILALLLLLLGAATTHTLDSVVSAIVAHRRLAPAVVDPPRRLALALLQRDTVTERPDMPLWLLAPAVYAMAACAALLVVPLDDAVAIADLRPGIVVFGAAEAIVIVAVFLHGWSSNSHLSLLGAWRFVALGLSYELLSMFVLIAAALPAESLQLSAIVRSQAELPNAIRQPLGLPLWIVVTWGLSFWGPLDLADSRDLCGGTSVETSGRQRVLWQAARGAMLAVASAMGAAALLGGWVGPWLPGWAWMLVKTVALMAVTLAVARIVPRLLVERAVRLLWTVALPVSFLHLFLAGLEAM